MIDRLVRALAAGSELAAEEILDVLWLAASHPTGQAASVGGEPIADESVARSFEGSGPESVPDALLHLHMDSEPVGTGEHVPATEIGFRVPRQIPDALTLPIALRRFRQVRAPGSHLMVDIDATVDATAEARRLMPVLSRPQERALDLALVVDDSASMRIWHDTFDDLERLLGQTGAFRSVLRWRLSARDGAIRPDGPSPLNHLRGRQRRPSDPSRAEDLRRVVRARRSLQPAQRLIDPSGRRLVLVATDARDEAWYTAPPWDAVAAWCAAMPTVLVQVLPQRYWAGTAVGDPYIAARTRRPAAPNAQYQRHLAWWATDTGGLPLPVVTLAPQAVDAWAQAVVNGTAWANGITATPPDPNDAPPATDSETEPDALVNEFLARASPGAQRLARILANAATLSMPLVSVLRERLAPETGVLELAEILASGLLQETWPTASTGQPQLRHRPGTREILQRGTTALEEWDAYTAISRYLEERQQIGGRLRALVPDADGSAVLDAGEEPFAELHQTLATRLGLRSPATQAPPRHQSPIADATSGVTPHAGKAPEPETESGDRTADRTKALAEEETLPALQEAGQEESATETDVFDRASLLGYEELYAALQEAINDLGDSDEIRVAELGVTKLIQWRIYRNDMGTPQIAKLDSPPPTISLPRAAWEKYAKRSILASDDTSFIVFSPSDNYFPFDPNNLRAESAQAYEISTPVENLLHEIIIKSPLTRAYELVVLNTHSSGRLMLNTRELFRPGMICGTRTELSIQCAPANDHKIVIAVVSRKDDGAFMLLSAWTTAIEPGNYRLAAVLDQPGQVTLEGLPNELQAESRPWGEIIATIPDRLVGPRPTHIICVVEITGSSDRMRRRAALLAGLIDSASELGRNVTVSLVTYGMHEFERKVPGQVPTVLAWAANSRQALAAIRGLATQRMPEHGYGNAAQLECALKEVAIRISDGYGRPVLVTVGIRPPHPPRVNRRTEIMPCPRKVDWREQIYRLRMIPGITFGALWDSDKSENVGREFGRDAFARVDDVNVHQFARALGLRERVVVGPFPLIVSESTIATEMTVTPEATSGHGESEMDNVGPRGPRQEQLLPVAPPERMAGSINRVALAAGTTLWRVHNRSQLGSTFRLLRESIDLTGGRFDGTEHDPYPVLYASLTPEGALIMALGIGAILGERPRLLPKARVHGLVLSQMILTRDAVLADLTTEADLASFGGNKWLVETGPRDFPLTRVWASWLRAQAPWAQGLLWSEPLRPAKSSLVLFGDRFQGHLLEAQGQPVALDDDAGVRMLNRRVASYELMIMPPRTEEQGQASQDEIDDDTR